jgi:hypothetical protein
VRDQNTGIEHPANPPHTTRISLSLSATVLLRDLSSSH